MQSRKRAKPSSSSCPSSPRRPHCCHQEHLQHRRRPSPVHPHRNPRRNPRSVVSSSPSSKSCRSIKIHRPRTHHLSEGVRANPVHPNPLKSDDPRCRSGRSGTHQPERAAWPASDQNRVQIEIPNQILTRSCKIHIFRFTNPKIANNISLESLEHLDFSRTKISYILWVQFESIFRTESNHLLTCLNHIFSSVNPKITNL
jgi:hypothetical protein